MKNCWKLGFVNSIENNKANSKISKTWGNVCIYEYKHVNEEIFQIAFPNYEKSCILQVCPKHEKLIYMKFDIMT